MIVVLVLYVYPTSGQKEMDAGQEVRLVVVGVKQAEDNRKWKFRNRDGHFLFFPLLS